MALISDILLVAGALGAAIYCMILSRRLRRFNDLENGMGGAIAVLSAQVDDMTRALDEARISARSSSSSLVDLTGRAEGVAQRLELLVASLHDLPVADEKPKNTKDKAAAVIEIEESAGPPDVEPQAPAELSFVRSPGRAQAIRKEPPLILRNRSKEAAE